MFVGEEVLLDVGFTAATARLANLVHGGSLVTASQDAYGEGITGLMRVGPLGPGAAVSRLVKVHFAELVSREDSAVLTLRWEAQGTGGGLFPVLDADIMLAPAGEQATMLRLAGAYRPPLGVFGAGLNWAILHRVAAATVRSFVGRMADAITHPATAAERGRGYAGTEPSWPPPAAEMP